MEIMAFDIGDDIVGIIDLKTDAYTRYRGECMVEGAKRILSCDGVIISFNGTRYDLPMLVRLAGPSASDTLALRGIHHDMQIEASRDRWPPPHGTAPIVGPCLRDHYQHYYGNAPPDPPKCLKDEYERNNWLDCYMASELWRKIVLTRDPTMGFISGKPPRSDAT